MTKIDEVVARFFTDANKFLPSGTAIKPIAPDQLRAILQEVHDAAVAEAVKTCEIAYGEGLRVMDCARRIAAAKEKP